ncbi:class I glutamine amidotransferase-like protein [Corynespora cassiicola Philippines]|uniref:Class I glutamine amidotransferase-like protein n=1 Tax=Corynespora cassiicola Philippines TaxID=1448308 RepID=A0A2T2NMW3_CORCC|nr:class I glutamine amidotransferase-like protein [Corynespora cassiicola Philippines]
MKLVFLSLLGVAGLAKIVGGANGPDEERHSFNAARDISIGYVVFNGYAPLDLWGPLQILTTLSADYNMTLSIISKEAGPVSSSSPPHRMPNGEMMSTDHVINSTMLATHTPETAPPLNLLMIPGGLGNRNMGNDTWIEDFARARFNSTDYVASVCTGAMSLAKAGVLDGRRATTNKRAWSEVVQHGNNVTWVPNARWTHDGKVWTSSGVAAGMDMTYALLSWMYGSEKVNSTMNLIELAPHTDEHWDPYAVVHKVPGADTTRPMKDLVGPVGYD